MDCFVALLLAMTVLIHGLLPGEYRLFQFGHAGIAPLQHFAELIDPGRGRRVDESAGVTKPDHAPRALGNGGKGEGVSLCKLNKRGTMPPSPLSRIWRDRNAPGGPPPPRRTEGDGPAL